MLSAWLMYRRFAQALKVAAREEGFVAILGASVLLVIVGTVTYPTSQNWSLVDGFYFAVATLTTSSIADPHLDQERPNQDLHRFLHPRRHRHPGRTRAATGLRFR
jgi:hypothetical protein